MKAIKLIDIFVDIANGKEAPKKIKFCDKIWEYNYDVSDYSYYLIDHYEYLLNVITFSYLNDKVEIIEDTSKKIEQIGKSYNIRKYSPEDDAYNYDLDKLIDMVQDIYNKQSEIIDIINGEENG